MSHRFEKCLRDDWQSLCDELLLCNGIKSEFIVVWLTQVVEVIAQGAFGNVLKVQREDDKQFYAMKVSRYGAFLLLLFRRRVWNFLTFHIPLLHFSPCLQIPKLVKTSALLRMFSKYK